MTRRVLFSLVLLPAASFCQPSTVTYYVGFLRTAPAAVKLPDEEAKTLQAAHMAHIQFMAKAGALIGAGPVLSSPNLRGIFIFRTTSFDEAKEIAEQDPTIKRGQMIIDVHPWQGPADLGAQYAANKKAHPEAPDRMIEMQLCLIKSDPAVLPDRLPKVLASGPFLDGGDLKALYFIDAGSKADADAILSKYGVTFETHRWLSAAGVIPAP